LGRIFSIEQLNNNLKQEIMPLSYTPRKFIQHPSRPVFYTLETDHNTSPLPNSQQNGHANGDADGDVDGYDAVQYGLPKTGQGHWASCIRVIDPLAKETVLRLDLEEDEAAFCGDIVHFSGRGEESYLCVGVGKGISFNPPAVPGAFINTYLISPDGRSLELVHKTPVEQPPGALMAFQGRLMAGVGRSLRLYELGIQRLLRKHDSDVSPPSPSSKNSELTVQVAHKKIVGLESQGNRVMIADVQESVSFAMYKHVDNKFLVFCDDYVSRWTTASVMMDYDTIVGGDKFGNLWILRCPADVSIAAEDDIKVAQMMHEKASLNGAPHKLDMLAHYFLNDIPTGLHRTRLVSGGRDVLLYSGLMGTVGIYIPFVSRDDIEFFQQLEAHLRSEDQPIAGRDHMIYRGYYVPVKGTIDGDLCERFGSLAAEKQRRIANEMDRSVAEVQKKIEDMRVRVAY
jgi:splicing factor 3B subunit 3